MWNEVQAVRITVVTNYLFLHVAYQNSEQQGAIFQIPEQQIIFQLPEQQRVLQPPEQEVIFQPEQHGVLFQDSQQGVIFENPKQNTDDFAPDGSQIAEQDNDFTISCTGLNRICTSKKDCVNGYAHLGKSAIYPSSIKVNTMFLKYYDYLWQTKL